MIITGLILVFTSIYGGNRLTIRLVQDGWIKENTDKEIPVEVYNAYFLMENLYFAMFISGTALTVIGMITNVLFPFIRNLIFN